MHTLMKCVENAYVGQAAFLSKFKLCTWQDGSRKILEALYYYEYNAPIYSK
jgi:hypothetical protein